MKNGLKVTHVIITPITPNEGHIGYASVFINDKGLLLTSIAVYRKRSGGFRILYPTSTKTRSNYYRPISQDTSRLIESAIFCECERVFCGKK